MGDIEVPNDKLWGAQTQRSLHHFHFPGETMPLEVVRAQVLVKKASASVNMALGVLDKEGKGAPSSRPPTKRLAGKLDEHFPLVVWQTGSGTQTNMNVNEVLANRASEMLGGERGMKSGWCTRTTMSTKGQSSNDTFPHRDARGGGDRARTAAQARGEKAARHAAQKIQEIHEHREDRPHPSAGRHAAHAGPGIFRLRGAARSRPEAHRRRAAASVRAGAGRHRGGHRAQRASRSSR